MNVLKNCYDEVLLTNKDTFCKRVSKVNMWLWTEDQIRRSCNNIDLN